MWEKSISDIQRIVLLSCASEYRGKSVLLIGLGWSWPRTTHRYQVMSTGNGRNTCPLQSKHNGWTLGGSTHARTHTTFAG